MGADVLDVERAADHGFQRVIGGVALRDVELGVARVADARREAEAREVHQGEDVIGEARRVGVMLLDPQVGLVVQQAVEHVGRIAHADVHDLGVKWRVLVRNVGVERPPRLLPYFGLMWPVLSALLPVRKFWPSDDEVVPSPQCSAKGWRNCALTRSASAAPQVSSRMCRACSQASFA